MNCYRFPESYCGRAALRQAFFLAVPMAIVAPIALVLIVSRMEWERQAPLIAAFVMPPFMILLIGVSIVRRYFRTRAALRTFQVILEGDALTRTMEYMNDLTLFRDEVTDLAETPGLGLMVRAKGSGRAIFASVQLVGYDALRAELGSWGEIRTKPASMFNYKTTLAALIVLVTGAFLPMLFTMNPYVVVPCGSFLIALLLWSFWSVQRSKDFDVRVKRMMWVVFLPILSFLGMIAVSLGFFPTQ